MAELRRGVRFKKQHFLSVSFWLAQTPPGQCAGCWGMPLSLLVLRGDLIPKGWGLQAGKESELGNPSLSLWGYKIWHHVQGYAQTRSYDVEDTLDVYRLSPDFCLVWLIMPSSNCASAHRRFTTVFFSFFLCFAEIHTDTVFSADKCKLVHKGEHTNLILCALQLTPGYLYLSGGRSWGQERQRSWNGSSMFGEVKEENRA